MSWGDDLLSLHLNLCLSYCRRGPWGAGGEAGAETAGLHTVMEPAFLPTQLPHPVFLLHFHELLMEFSYSIRAKNHHHLRGKPQPLGLEGKKDAL